MLFKQIESVALNILLIVIVTAAGAVATAGMQGGIHNFEDLSNAVAHGLLAGALVAFGWLGMRSPFAAQVRTLLGTSTVTEPGGKTTETTVEIQEPAGPTPPVNPPKTQ